MRNSECSEVQINTTATCNSNSNHTVKLIPLYWSIPRLNVFCFLYAQISPEWTCSPDTAALPPYSSQTCCSQLEPHPTCSNSSNCPQRHPGVPHSSGAGALEGGAGGSVWWSGKHRTGSYCENSNEFNSYYAAEASVSFKYKHFATWNHMFVCSWKTQVVICSFSVVCPFHLTSSADCLFFCWIKRKHQQTFKLFVSVAEEGAEPHAGSGRGVEEERPRERSSGQEEGGVHSLHKYTQWSHVSSSPARSSVQTNTRST